jgi:hypothetical protein
MAVATSSCMGIRAEESARRTSKAEEKAQAQLRQLIAGYKTTFLVQAAAELGLADLLAEGTRDVDQLAALTGAKSEALRRLLFALAQLGLLSRQPGDRFTLTPLGQCLRADHPAGLNAFARYQAHDIVQRCWANLTYTVRSGETAFDAVFGAQPFAYFAEHRDEAALFTAGMAARTSEHLEVIVQSYDWTSFDTIVDVGGADGMFLSAILKTAPGARGIVFDQPRGAAAAADRIAAEGLEPRCRFIGGDFFTAVPPDGDAYLLKYILHDWDDERVVAILQAVRRAMSDGGRLLVIEPLIPESDEPALETAMMDIAMLVFSGGCERTASEFAELYRRAGFRLAQVVPTGSMFRIVEGVPA